MLLQAADSSIGTIILSIVATVGAGGLVKLVQAYYKNKASKRKDLGSDGLAFRESLQERVVDLEQKLDHLNERIEDMIEMYTEKILALSTEKATLIAENKSYITEIATLKEKARTSKS